MFLCAQRLPRLADGPQRHRRVAAAAGLAMTAHTHQHKAAALPEAPQLLGIAKTDGEIILLSVRTCAARQRLADALALTRRMDRYAGDAPPDKRRRQR
ncbi:hypothetical protein D3C81_1603470 [compost metagenome]